MYSPEVGSAELLQALPDPALIIQPDGEVTFANAAAERFLGIDPDRSSSARITDYLPEGERQRLQPLRWLLRWAETPEAPEREFVHLTCRVAGADGQSSALTQVRASVGRLEGAAPCYVIVLHDVGAELARQRKARDAHRIAARVLAISADAVVNVDQQQRIEYVNASAEQLFGYTSAELIGEPLLKLIPERFRSEHGREMDAFLDGGSPSRFMGERGSVTGLTRDGQEIPLEASISKVTIDQGVTYSALVRDLRPRIATEHVLAQSNARFAMVFDNALQAMALLEPDGTVLELNRAARALLRDDANVTGAAFSALPWWTAASVAAELEQALEQCRDGEAFHTRAELAKSGSEPVGFDVSLTPLSEGESVFAIIAEARELR